MSENETDTEETILETFDKEYFESLKTEDNLYNKLPGIKQQNYIAEIVRGTTAHNKELTAYIEKFSVGWKIGRISKTALAIMKVAMFEALHMPDVPESVAINEAVELAKKYETPETVAFINGVLGSFARETMPQDA